MKLSLSFLATNSNQLPLPGIYGNEAVEGVIFNRQDLEDDHWRTVWRSIGKAVEWYGSTNVTFHFPVNESDYVDDSFVLGRLTSAYLKSAEMGLQGLVVHSNRIRKIDRWKDINLVDERKRVTEKLAEIANLGGRSNTWLALENMPVMDNFGKEIDPLFSYPNDFRVLNGLPIGIVWDSCHFTNTL